MTCLKLVMIIKGMTVSLVLVLRIVSWQGAAGLHEMGHLSFWGETKSPKQGPAFDHVFSCDGDVDYISHYKWSTLTMFLNTVVVAENDTETSQLLWNSILQKEMLHWKFLSVIFSVAFVWHNKDDSRIGLSHYNSEPNRIIIGLRFQCD